MYINFKNYLQAQCDAQMDTLTSEQASTLVAHLSLGPIYTILQGHHSKPLSSIPAMNPSNISTFAVSTNIIPFVYKFIFKIFFSFFFLVKIGDIISYTRYLPATSIIPFSKC